MTVPGMCRLVGIDGDGELDFQFRPATRRDCRRSGSRECGGRRDLGVFAESSHGFATTFKFSRKRAPLARADRRLRSRAGTLGETLQVRATTERSASFDMPGLADMTAHVDFEHLCATSGRRRAGNRRTGHAGRISRPARDQRARVAPHEANPEKACDIEAGRGAAHGAERYGRALQGDRHHEARQVALHPGFATAPDSA